MEAKPHKKWSLYFVEILSYVFLFIVIYKLLIFAFKRITTPLNKLKSASTLPLIGGYMVGMFSTPEECFENIHRICQENRPIFKWSHLHTDSVELVNPGDMELVLNSQKHMEKSYVYNFLRNWLGDGLLLSTGEKWHTRRKLLTPAFHLQIMQEFLVSFNEETEELVKKINIALEDSNVIHIKPLVSWFTLQSLGDTAMGFETIDEGILIDYRKKVLRMGDFFLERLFKPWLHLNFIYERTKTGFDEKVVVQGLHRFSETVIRRRKMMHKDIADGRDIFYKKKMALLDMLIKEQQNGKVSLTDQDIREEVDTFMFEGHDTASSIIELMLLMLANHPDIQDKVYKEIVEVTGKEYRFITTDDLANLKYLEMCLKETLRLYPSVPTIARYSGEQFVTTTGYTIPKGTPMHLHIWDLHRDPALFSDPEKFDPERFTLENCAARTPYSYVPFSAGPRNCIGQKFAMHEIKTVISGILKHFRLEPVTKVKDVKFILHFTLKTSTKIEVKFIRR